MTRKTGRYIGWAELKPSGSVVAGSVGTYTLTYHVGEYGIDDGGTLKIAWRFASDWGRPQSQDPTALDYCTVTTDGPGRISHRWDPKGYVRPWQKCLVIDVSEWALSRGERITVVYGDRSGGSAGTVAQTFQERTFEFKVCVDPFGTGRFIEIEDQPAVEIVPASPARLVLTAPTRVVRGEPFPLGVKLEDEWGNPVRGHKGRVALDPGGLEGVPAEVVFTRGEGGVQRIQEVSAEAGGTYRVSARIGPLKAESNPVVCVDGGERFAPYWGDLHGQSEETVGTNSLEDYLLFARDVALLDFAGHQGNDFQITPAFWDRIGRRAREFDAPGRFVFFPGYEWSATTPAGGDRNVYYLEDGLPIHRTSHWQVDDREDLASDRYPVEELFAELRRGGPALVVPHIGGRPANLRYHDPELEPVIEIYSAWGQFEWLLEEALERGCRVGFVAGSDDHKGRPGASYPGAASFGVYGGLTCVLATELTRKGVWEALRARRCYATTGRRIDLDVRAQDGTRWIGEGLRRRPHPALGLRRGHRRSRRGASHARKGVRLQPPRPSRAGPGPAPRRLERSPYPGPRPPGALGRVAHPSRRANPLGRWVRLRQRRRGHRRADGRAGGLAIGHLGRRGRRPPRRRRRSRGQASLRDRHRLLRSGPGGGHRSALGARGGRGGPPGPGRAGAGRLRKQLPFRIHRAGARRRPSPSLLRPGDPDRRIPCLDKPFLRGLVTTVVHVTHEAVHKVGGIGAVLTGLITAGSYRRAVERTILVGPLLRRPGSEALGPEGILLHDSRNGVRSDAAGEALSKVEARRGVRILYGRRRLRCPDGAVEPEVLLVDVESVAPNGLDRFKHQLYQAFGLSSDRYEEEWEYELYVRLAEPAYEAVLALLGHRRGRPLHVLAHEFMGLPTAFKALLADEPGVHTLFYAHEVATARRLVERGPGGDARFYGALRAAIPRGCFVEDVFGPQDDFFKHALVSRAWRCHAVLAVGDLVVEELRFLGREFAGLEIDRVYNGLPPAPALARTDRRRARESLAGLVESLTGCRPRGVFTHVGRLVPSKGFWRDLQVLEGLEAMAPSTGPWALIVLATDAEPRPPEAVAAMRAEYGWPTAHREGPPDLTPGNWASTSG